MAALRGVALSALSGMRPSYTKELMDWKLNLLRGSNSDQKAYLEHCELTQAMQVEHNKSLEKLQQDSAASIADIQQSASAAVKECSEVPLSKKEEGSRTAAVAALEARIAAAALVPKLPRRKTYKTASGRRKHVRPYSTKNLFTQAQIDAWEEARQVERQRLYYLLRSEGRDGALVAKEDQNAKELAAAKNSRNDLTIMLAQTDRELAAIRGDEERLIRLLRDDLRDYQAGDDDLRKDHVQRLEQHTSEHLKTMDAIADASKRKRQGVRALALPLRCGAYLLAAYAVSIVLLGANEKAEPVEAQQTSESEG